MHSRPSSADFSCLRRALLDHHISTATRPAALAMDQRFSPVAVILLASSAATLAWAHHCFLVFTWAATQARVFQQHYCLSYH